MEGHQLKRHLSVISIFAFSLAGLANPVPVRHPEGLVHGFLVLRSEDGKILAHGDLLQNSHGDEVTSRVVFHFNDGSVYDETTVFSQREQFKLLSNHVVRKGKTFDSPVETSIDATTGHVEVHDKGKDGRDKVKTEHVDVPADAANGMALVLLKNIASDSLPAGLSMIVTEPKLRIVKLNVQSGGLDSFAIAGSPHKATHFILRVEIGGVAGAAAHILGKQPPDINVWIQEGEAPAFVKSRGPLFSGGPIWQIELASPTWPAQSPAANGEKRK